MADSGKRKRAWEVGMVLGIVFVAMGLATGNSGLWMPGLIFAGIGLWARFR